MKKLFLTALVFAGITATAQVKVGTNPTTLATNAQFQVEGTTAASDQFVVLKSGFVGIGTTAPGYQLSVKSASAASAFTADFQQPNTPTGGFTGLNIGWNGGTNDSFHILAQKAGAGLATNRLSFNSWGTAEIMSLLAGGNVGIGTAAPVQKLDVAGYVRTNTGFMCAANGVVGAPAFFREFDPTGIYFPATSNLGFVSAGVERMRINGNGNVGIGTTTPTSSFVTRYLHIADATGVSAGVVMSGVKRFSVFSSSSSSLNFTDETAGVHRMLIDTNGNVGIGTASPTQLLTVTKDQAAQTQILVSNAGTAGATTITSFGLGENNVAYGELRRFRDGSGLMELINRQNSPIVFSTNLIERMRILGTGNVGIGTAAPASMLDVAGGDVATNNYLRVNSWPGYGTGAGLIWYDGAGGLGAGATGGMTFCGSTLYVQDGNGNVGIGQTSPTAKLHVVGNVVATGGYADYVLENFVDGKSEMNPAYKMQNLNEVEAFIKTNKHLPGVTSIKDLTVASNGQYEIDITKLQVQMLEKVEELYLHTIEQNKQIEALKAEVAKLKK